MNKALALFDRVVKKGAEAILMVDPLKDRAEAARRLEVCKSNAGGCYNAPRDKCKKCGCYMMAKTKLLKNINPKKMGRVEITHCPLAKWGAGQGPNGENTELEIANYYRSLDGEELLTN